VEGRWSMLLIPAHTANNFLTILTDYYTYSLYSGTF